MKRVTFADDVSYSDHAKERCEQRRIGKLEIIDALKHGVSSRGNPRPNGNPTTIYTSDRVVCILDDIEAEVVTTYTRPEVLEEALVAEEEIEEHEATKQDACANLNWWKSYTVILVDTSGSMATSDVTGSKTRLEAVWKALANDYVFSRIEQGTGGMKDAVSILSLGNTCSTLLLNEPTTWVLYNKICRLLKDKKAKPYGHGHYLPSLDSAEKLLSQYLLHSSGVANLVLLSDGRPSDRQVMKTSRDMSWDAIERRIVDIARQFGSRLNLSTIGIGNPGDFIVLQRMVEAASDYGVRASFYLPSKTSAGIGTSFTASATALSTLQTDMIDESKTAEVRAMLSVEHESRKVARTIPAQIDFKDFRVFPLGHVRCEIFRFQRQRYGNQKVRKGVFIEGHMHPDAVSVAMKTLALGQGKERFAFQCYLIGSRRRVVDQPMVAKLSCRVADNAGKREKRSEFVYRYVFTQQVTRNFAKGFNRKLDSLRRVGKQTPRIGVLDCWVYHLGRNLSVLVEPRLDHWQWTKWNSNNGYTQDVGPSKRSELVRNMVLQRITSGTEVHSSLQDVRDLETGEADSEHECTEPSDSESEDGNEYAFSMNDEDDEDRPHRPKKRRAKKTSTICFSAYEVAQAFSHYSYAVSWGKRLVCDIQGVHDTRDNQLLISDPVIHYYNNKKEHRKNVHGRADLGFLGMRRFFKTHECSELCELVINGLRAVPGRNAHQCKS